MFWDAEHRLIVINYFPGYAYIWLLVWTFGWLALTILACMPNPVTTGRCRIPVRLVAAAAFLYWLFWLVIPLLGYTWFFAWGYLDAAVSQAASFSNASGPTAAAPPPFSPVAGQALARPFATGIWLGFGCWLAGSFTATYQNGRHYLRLRNDPEYRQARFLAANMADPVVQRAAAAEQRAAAPAAAAPSGLGGQLELV